MMSEIISPAPSKKLLRVATIDQERIVVRSVDIDIIDDETFGDVGVISYTWGFGRSSWCDEETGLKWEISDRSLSICREALRYFKRVWMDSICIIQADPEHHQAANLKISTFVDS